VAGTEADLDDYNDEDLMQMYANGDFQAFEVLYGRHKGGLYRYFSRQTTNNTLAEDLFQDVWSRVIANAGRYQANAKFTTWLYTLAHNKLVDNLRHIKVVEKVIDEEQTYEDLQHFQTEHKSKNPEDALQASLEVIALKHCLPKLPRMQLDSFLLKEEGALSLADIALVLDASLQATKSRLRYAYRSLRECIELKLGKEIT
jgi:RNA polymerase sigma-70 factor (ECF subfamily)